MYNLTVEKILSRFYVQIFIIVVIFLNSIFILAAPDRLRFDLLALIVFIGISVWLIYLKMSEKYKKAILSEKGFFDFLLIINFIIYISSYIGAHYVGLECQDLSKKYRCGCYSIMAAEFREVSLGNISTMLNEKYCPDWEVKP